MKNATLFVWLCVIRSFPDHNPVVLQQEIAACKGFEKDQSIGKTNRGGIVQTRGVGGSVVPNAERELTAFQISSSPTLYPQQAFDGMRVHKKGSLSSQPLANHAS